jgi:ribonuclease D
MPAQIGYGELVRQRLGLDLAKAHARADWSRRPLSAEQLDYAADDVRYLTALHADLCHALEHAGRLPWLFEETAALEDPGLYETLPADAWRRLRGLDRLKPAQRAVAKALAAWRERVARNSDRPRGWILSDDALRAIAERLPADVAALGAVASVPEGVTRKRGSELIALVAAAQADATTEQAVLPPARPEPALVNRVSRLMQIVRSESARLGVSQELLATRRDIERLVYSGDPGVLAEGWRSAVIGARLISS